VWISINASLGLKAATVEFVARVDDDDVSSSDRFESQVNYLMHNDKSTLVCGFAEVVDRTGTLLYWFKQPIDSLDFALRLAKDNIIPHSIVMFRLGPVLALGSYSETLRGCEDYEL
jgi:hypothetical protein